MIAIFLISCMFYNADEAYVLWLKNNKTMKLQQAPECKDSRCLLVLMNGQKTTLPSRMIDLTRSESYNQELAEKRQAEALALAEAQAAEQAKAAKQEAKKKDKRIVLTQDDELPKFNRSAGSTSGIVKVDEDPLGPPLERNFRPSPGQIFVASESVTSYPSAHILRASVTIDNDNGVDWIDLGIKVLFDNAAATSMEQRVNGPFRKGESVNVEFKIEEADKLREVVYDLKGQESAATPAPTAEGTDPETDPDDQ